MTNDLGIDHIIEAEFQRIMKKLTGATLYGRSIDPFNNKQLLVAAYYAGYYLDGPFTVNAKEVVQEGK